MVLGRRGRARAELLDLVRVELTGARVEMQASIAEALSGFGARVSAELEDREQAGRAFVATLDVVRRDLAGRDVDLVQALRRVAEACEGVAEEIRAERSERAALVDAVARLAEAPMPRHTVLGGTIDPALASREDPVEVRCRFGDRWIAGFEVCETVHADDVVRYRLRRRSDGSVLPELFGERDVRFDISLAER